MNFNKWFSEQKCPNCGQYTISYWQKMKLIDYRFSYSCKKCGGTIKLPAWHIPLFLSEIIFMIFVIVKLSLSSWEAMILGAVVMIFVWFIQLPFVPIKS